MDLDSWPKYSQGLLFALTLQPLTLATNYGERASHEPGTVWNPVTCMHSFNPQNNIKDQVLGSVSILKRQGDFPGDPMVTNLLCNTEDAGSILGQGTKIPHAVEQLSLHVTTRESMCCNKRTSMLQIRPNAKKKKKRGGKWGRGLYFITQRMSKLHIQGHAASTWECQNLVLGSWGPAPGLFMCSLPHRTKIDCFYILLLG